MGQPGLLSLVLVGLPELEDRLSLSTHKSLLSPPHTRLRLEPTTPPGGGA